MLEYRSAAHTAEAEAALVVSSLTGTDANPAIRDAFALSGYVHLGMLHHVRPCFVRTSKFARVAFRQAPVSYLQCRDCHGFW